jgi:hypothetical protein
MIEGIASYTLKGEDGKIGASSAAYDTDVRMTLS